MTQLVINHSDKISNIDAVNVVSEFIRDVSNGICLTNSREQYTRSGDVVLVQELPHDNLEESPCSSVFQVDKLTKE